MPNDELRDSRDFQSLFWVRARISDLITVDNQTDGSLAECIQLHPTFRVGHSNRSYFNEDKFVEPSDWHVTFWTQRYQDAHRQGFNLATQVQEFIEGIALGWSGYNPSLAFSSNQLGLKHDRQIAKLCVNFNEEAKRQKLDFLAAMQPYVSLVSLGAENNSDIELVLAKRRDGFKSNKAREAFTSSLERRFGAFKTRPYAIESLIIGQGFFSSSGCMKGQRDIAEVKRDGQINWLFKDDTGKMANPFNPQINDTLVNRAARALIAA